MWREPLSSKARKRQHWPQQPAAFAATGRSHSTNIFMSAGEIAWNFIVPLRVSTESAHVWPTHCSRRTICRSNYELLRVGRVRRCIVNIIKARYKVLLYEDYYCSASDRMRPTHQSDRCDHSQNRRPTRGRRIAADYERHNAFLVFITNAADARPTFRPTMRTDL